MKTMTCRKTAKMMTELVCPCGHRLEVSVKFNGWYIDLLDVAHASGWRVQDSPMLSQHIAAKCPQCRD